MEEINSTEKALNSMRDAIGLRKIVPLIFYNEEKMEGAISSDNCFTMILPLEKTDYDGLYTDCRVDDHYENHFGAGRLCFSALEWMLSDFTMTKDQAINALRRFDISIRSRFDKAIDDSFSDIPYYEELPKIIQYDQEAIRKLHCDICRIYMASDSYEHNKEVNGQSFRRDSQQ